ncbi:diguanylate cyclase [Vogesella sp. LIG4]|uniref:GGDEF domain-containing protein n=1 Tax=Vogesella sp. LIG4 TaxID=1192162 RepID=UPI000B5ACA5A|nr:diguanylate cyclase [Vogesella sp. LIG4]
MKLPTSLRLQLLWRALLFCSLSGALLLGLLLYQGYRAKQQQLADIPQRIELQLMPMLAQSVWDVDQTATQKLLQNLLQQDGVRQISLRSTDGSVLLQLGSRDETVTHIVELPVQSARTGDQPLGLLRIGLSLGTLEQQLWRDSLTLLLLMLAALAGLTLVCYRFLLQQVLHPVQQLQGRLNTQPPQEDSSSNELQQLSASLQLLQQQHQEQDSSQQQHEREQARHRDQLTEMVALRTAELEHLSRFQHLVSELSTAFVHMPLHEQHQAVATALERIGSLLGVDRCYLFRVTPDMLIRDNQEWCAAGIVSTASHYESYPLRQSQWFVQQLQRHQFLAYASLADIPQEGHVERELFEQHGIQSIALVALSQQEQLLGIFGCDAVSHTRVWLDKELSLLRLVGEMLSGLLLRQEQQAQLEAAQAALSRANEKLDGIANTDGLTGLANRRLFDQRKQQEFAAACALKQELSLLLIDVDLFKAYNDCFGHQEGDQCLRQLAAALTQQFAGEEQLIARLGGEEFAVLLPHCDARAASQLAEALRQHIWQLAIPHMASPVSTNVTVSIGVASLDRHRHDSMEDLQAEADSRLYQAKHQGRNRVIGPEPVRQA